MKVLLVSVLMLWSATVPQEAADERAGHERMVATLAEVVAQTGTNPYLGGDQIADLEAQLAEAGDDAPPGKRARLRYELGLALLRMGRIEQGIAEMERSREVLQTIPPKKQPRFARRLPFELGVAHMRWGETQNCVARHTSKSCIFPIEGDGVHVDQEGSRKAIEYFGEVLARTQHGRPQHLCAMWLLNVAYMTIGGYPDDVPPDLVIDPKIFAPEAAFPRFVDIAPDLDLNTFDLSGGAIAEDFDRDGFLDILTSTWDAAGQIRFFRNAGDGTFTDRTTAAGLTGIVGGLNLVPGDYNGDGLVDAVVLRGAWLPGKHGRQPNSLLRNNGDGTFLDVTFAAGLADARYPTQTAAWADYDNDGDLDLYVGAEANETHAYPCQLFRNEGDGTFTDVAKQAGVANLRFAKGATWGDYDGDRLPDLYVSNLGGANRLYHNLGDGTFADVAPELGVAGPSDSFPVWFWDYDNDGALDLYVSSYYQNVFYRFAPVVASYLGLPHEAEPACLYRGDGRGGFEDVAAKVNLARISLPMGANFGDLDNDGFLDFYLGTGYPGYEGIVPNVMYWNRGGERFADITTAGGFGHLQKGHGVTFADFDNDGDQDVFEQMGGAYPGDAFGNVFYENPGFARHRLKIELVGRESNRLGLGARIRLVFQDGEAERSVYRHVTSGGSFGGSPFLQHVGVGAAESIDTLEVYWPTSDVTQTFTDVPADLRIEITEGVEEYRVIPEKTLALGG